MNQNEILHFISSLNQEYIGPLLAVVLLGTGLFFTFRLGFVQRHFFYAIRLLFQQNNSSSASKKEGMSPFQALTTAIASQIGTGNIVGVSTALMAGGPGAIFWLWISSLVGMSTNFAEAVLGQLYKGEKDGHVIGGPVYYILNGLGSKVLAGIFSVFLILALGITGIMVQANSIVNAINCVTPTDINELYIGMVLMVIVGLVLAGGITRIASFAERIVPFMALLFVLGSIVFVGMHASQLPDVFTDIFHYAFTPYAPAGGLLGASVMATIRYGVSRGLFSNEAGLGSTPHAHAIAKVKHPYEQALVALIGIGVNILICTLTALVILMSGVIESYPSAQGVAISQYAYCSAFGDFGDYFIAISLFFFAFTTIISWYFFAAQNVRYLFGERLVWPYRFVVMAVVLVASVLQVNLVWELADTFNFFLIIPNIIALIFLSPQVVKEVKAMRDNMKKK